MRYTENDDGLCLPRCPIKNDGTHIGSNECTTRCINHISHSEDNVVCHAEKSQISNNIERKVK